MTTFPYSNTTSNSVARAIGGPLQPATKTMAVVNGAFPEKNPRGIGSLGNLGAPSGQPRISYGDDGIYRSTSDLFKWKGGYDITPELKSLFTAAYENIQVNHQGQTYLSNKYGQPVWGTGTTSYNFGGLAFIPTPNNFGNSEQNRETLTLSGGLKGRLVNSWNIDANANSFEVLKDKNITSTLNPNDPNNRNVGQISRYDNTGWVNVSVKFNTDEFFGNKDLSFTTGYQFQHASLSLNTYNTFNYTTGIQNSVKTLSGGTTDTHGIFKQLSWRFMKDWDATLGVRWERWNSSDGVNYTGATATTKAVSVPPPDRQKTAVSPKFSIGYEPDRWKFRYSFAQAYRFPMVEELFSNFQSLNGSVTVSNSTLRPEDGRWPLMAGIHARPRHHLFLHARLRA